MSFPFPSFAKAARKLFYEKIGIVHQQIWKTSDYHKKEPFFLWSGYEYRLVHDDEGFPCFQVFVSIFPVGRTAFESTEMWSIEELVSEDYHPDAALVNLRHPCRDSQFSMIELQMRELQDLVRELRKEVNALTKEKEEREADEKRRREP